MESWLTEALESAGSALDAGGDHLTLLADPSQLQLDLSVPLQLLYDEVTAYRCRLCPSVHASVAEVSEHIEARHCQPETDTATDLILRQEAMLAEEPLLRQAAITETEAILGDEAMLTEGQMLRQVAGRSHDSEPDTLGVEQEALPSQETTSGTAEKQPEPTPKEEPPLMPKEVPSLAPMLLDAPIDENDKQLYLCGECGHVSETLQECKNHLRQAHASKRSKDSDTGKRLGSRAAEKKAADQTKKPAMVTQTQKKTRERRPPHKLRHDKRAMCRIDGCSQRFTCDQYRNIHERCHVDRKSFKCSECGEMSVNSWTRIKTHLWREHAIDLDLFGCDKCEFKSAFLSNLENHKLLHADTRSFVCPTCGKGFKQPAQLLNHRVVHAEQSNLPVPKWFEPQMCKICSKMFSSRKTLKIHNRIIHDQIRKFCCRVCSHTSATKALLELHMRGHSGEMPFICPEQTCDYRTRDPSSFRRHKMRHTGVRPYKCPRCTYQCIQATAFKCHVNSKHGGAGVFHCDLCAFCTVNHTSFAMHCNDHDRGLIAASSPDDDEDDDADDDGLTGLVARSGPNDASQISGVLSGDVSDDGQLERHEYVFTIAPDAPAEDRGGISIPAGEEDYHLVNGIIGGATVASLGASGHPVRLNL